MGGGGTTSDSCLFGVKCEEGYQKRKTGKRICTFWRHEPGFSTSVRIVVFFNIMKTKVEITFFVMSYGLSLNFRPVWWRSKLLLNHCKCVAKYFHIIANTRDVYHESWVFFFIPPSLLTLLALFYPTQTLDLPAFLQGHTYLASREAEVFLVMWATWMSVVVGWLVVYTHQFICLHVFCSHMSVCVMFQQDPGQRETRPSCSWMFSFEDLNTVFLVVKYVTITTALVNYIMFDPFSSSSLMYNF